MGKLLDLDSPVMRFLSRMADLLWLNLLTTFLCLPVVTAGAALTSLHYCCLKMVRGEEGYITKDYFKSFKMNFLQSTAIWLILLAAALLLGFDFKIVLNVEYPEAQQSLYSVIFIALCVISFFYAAVLMFVFAIQSHFINPVKKTLKNSLLMSIMVLPKTVLMILCWLIVPAVMYFVQYLFLLGLLFFVSLPVYLNAMIYNKTFKRFEPSVEVENDSDWTVSTDSEATDVRETDSEQAVIEGDNGAEDDNAECNVSDEAEDASEETEE